MASRHLPYSSWTFRRISVSISSRNVPEVECDINRWCSCVLSSTWIIAIQQRTDNNKLDMESNLSSFLPLFVCFVSPLSCPMSLLFVVQDLIKNTEKQQCLPESSNTSRPFMWKLRTGTKGKGLYFIIVSAPLTVTPIVTSWTLA